MIFLYYSVFYNIILEKFKINYLGYLWLWFLLKYRETLNEVKFYVVIDLVVNEVIV